VNKPKVTYAEFVAAQQARKREGSIAWFVDKRIEESKKPGARALGKSHRWILLARAKDPIGHVTFAEIKVSDIVDMGRLRKASGVKPQTCLQDVAFLRSMARFFVDLDMLPQTVLDTFSRAHRLLQKEQLIGKGQPRERRPTPEEIDIILAEIDATPAFWIPMRAIVEFSLHAGRRISETCRLRWTDLDEVKRTCWVRDLKNAAGKGHHGEFPLLGRAWEIVQEQPRVSEFIFSMQPKFGPRKGQWLQIRAPSASAAYTSLKKRLAKRHPGLFIGLRLHDNRAETFTRLFERGFSVPEVQLVSLHKGDAKTLIVHYTRLRPESLHAGPAALRRAA
jgi:integrase